MNNKLFLAKYGDESHVIDAMNHNNFNISRTAARNVNQTDKTFEAAMNSGDKLTLLHALNHPQFPEHLLRKTFEHNDMAVRSRTLNHPNFPQETHLFDKALEDPSAMIRSDVARSGKCSNESMIKYHTKLNTTGFSPI